MCPVVLIRANMRLIVVRPHGLIHGIVIIASIQAEVLWLLLGGSLTFYHKFN